MSILSEINTLLNTINIPVETGVLSGVPPDEYIVITPLVDTIAVFGDNNPLLEVQEVRLSLFSKKNYMQRKNQLVKLLLQADFTITQRRYVGHENDTGYHNYCVDIAKEYDFGEGN